MMGGLGAAPAARTKQEGESCRESGSQTACLSSCPPELPACWASCLPGVVAGVSTGLKLGARCGLAHARSIRVLVWLPLPGGDFWPKRALHLVALRGRPLGRPARSV